MKKIERKIKKNCVIPTLPFAEKREKYANGSEEKGQKNDTIAIKKSKQGWAYLAFALLFVVITASILCGVLIRHKEPEKTYGESDVVTTACERADLTNLDIFLPNFER